MTTRADERGLFKRGRRWYLRLYLKGKGKRVLALKPAGESHATTSKDVARALARDVRRQIEEKPEAVPAAARADLEALVEQFQAVNSMEASRRQARESTAKVRAFLKGMAIEQPGQIKVSAVQHWLGTLYKAGRAAKTVCNHRASISHFCEYLVDRELIVTNPCRRVKLPPTPKAIPRFLSPAEYDQALLIARDNGIFAEVASALQTGLRRGELRRMKWADVDFERAVLRVPTSKSKRPRTVPMSNQLREVLLAQREKTGEYKHVFAGQARSGHSSGMRRLSWWSAAIKPLQAAMPIFTDQMADRATGRGWHLLRHTFASRLVQAGVPLAKVSAWLGHSSIQTTMIYAHLAPGHDSDIEHA